MAILVTGGAGYIGSVTVDYLFARGEKVVVLDNLVRGHRQTLDAEVPFYQGDVGDHTLLAQIAQVGVRRFVFSSSCATYGEPEALPIKADSRQWPTSPYG